MNDQEWQSLDAQLKRAFDELRAACVKARKAHNVTTRAHAQTQHEPSSADANLPAESDQQASFDLPFAQGAGRSSASEQR